ncbi:MAG: KilA-N domain-containing protein, partial [Xenococcus sp. (in: cyanobacteria)]
FEGREIHQRIIDGYINLNQMAEANGKRIDNWLQNQSTKNLLSEIERQQNKLPGLPGSLLEPLITIEGRDGGTWAHPDIAIQFAQWCNPAFALQVSRWVREWMTTGRNPLADMDRVGLRDSLKDDSRIRMTDQVKEYLEQIKRYDDRKYSGIYFAKVHDAINQAITGETAKQMRERFSKELKQKIKQNELIRNYFPSKTLQLYISMCEASANLMLKKGRQPLTAVEEAADLVLPANYIPDPINFVEHIKEVRSRLQGDELKLFDIDNK